MISTAQLVRPTIQDAATTPAQHITLYRDPAGGAWVRTFLPLDQASVNNLEQLHLSGDLVLDVEPLPDEVVSRNAEMAWIHDHLNELTAANPGEWIAVDGAQLIAVAPELPLLIARAVAAGHPHPFVTVVPTGPDIPFFG
jgi:hypothetical protein